MRHAVVPAIPASRSFSTLCVKGAHMNLDFDGLMLDLPEVSRGLRVVALGLASLLVAGGAEAASPSGGKGEGLAKRLDAVIDSAIASRRIVGAVVVVLQDGRPVYRRAAGAADREEGRPMRAEQAFRLASVSKPIVTAALLRLADEGRLDLDDPVTKYLPDFQPKLADGDAPAIRLRQLLNHTAGLSYQHMEPANGPYQRAGVSDGLDQPGLAMDEELRRIAAAGLAYAPGTAWRYSVAIDVLGAVIERVTKSTLPKAVRTLVTGPLDMAGTEFAAPAREGLATPYADGSPPVRMGDPHVIPYFGLAGVRFSPGRTFDPRSFPSGGAGMNGTADDVARFLETVRSGGGKVLKPATAKAMMTSQTGHLPIVMGPGWGFGLGGAVLTAPKAAKTPQSAGTWAWGGAWGHSWFVDAGHRLVVVALTNTALEGMVGAFPSQVRDAVYGREAR